MTKRQRFVYGSPLIAKIIPCSNVMDIEGKVGVGFGMDYVGIAQW